MIKEYLDETTYDYEILSEFTHLGRNYVVAVEYAPTGQESEPFVLYEKNGEIYNNCGTNVKGY